MPGPACSICGESSRPPSFVVPEMMMGTGAEFDYFQCPKCRCIQIANIPANISDYYPATYYSFDPVRSGSVMNRFRRLRGSHYLRRPNLFGGALEAALGPHPQLRSLRAARRVHEITTGSRILDVGAGDGRLLANLAACDFRNLLGTDPYLISASPAHRATVFRDWFQLDAPRHLCIHSERSLALLTEQSGFRIRASYYDSTAAQFAVSENYAAGISISKGAANPPRLRHRLAYSRKARALNRTRQGDQATFIIENVN